MLIKSKKTNNNAIDEVSETAIQESTKDEVLKAISNHQGRLIFNSFSDFIKIREELKKLGNEDLISITSSLGLESIDMISSLSDSSILQRPLNFQILFNKDLEFQIGDTLIWYNNGDLLILNNEEKTKSDRTANPKLNPINLPRFGLSRIKEVSNEDNKQSRVITSTENTSTSSDYSIFSDFRYKDPFIGNRYDLNHIKYKTLVHFEDYFNHDMGIGWGNLETYYAIDVYLVFARFIKTSQPLWGSSVYSMFPETPHGYFVLEYELETKSRVLFKSWERNRVGEPTPTLPDIIDDGDGFRTSYTTCPPIKGGSTFRIAAHRGSSIDYQRYPDKLEFEIKGHVTIYLENPEDPQLKAKSIASREINIK